MVETYDENNDQDSQAVKKILQVAQKKIKNDLYRAWLNIDPQRRIDQKRIRRSIDGKLENGSDIIEIKPDDETDQSKVSKAKRILKNLFAHKEITLSEHKFINEFYRFDIDDHDLKEFIDNKKRWLKYLK
jgi:hypothetical protein